MRKKSVFALILTLALILVGCTKTNAPKTFSKEGMTITLDETFTEETYESYTACYSSYDMAVYVVKQGFTFFEDSVLGPKSTLMDYANMVIKSNGLENCTPSKNNGLVSFSFDRESNGNMFNYSAYVYKGTESFWLIQFAVEKDNLTSETQERILSFAKSVEVE